MKRIPVFFAVSLAAFISMSAATLAVAVTEDEQAAACRGDAMHFCAADIPDKEKITTCMKQHVNELSPACRAMFKGGKKSDTRGNSKGAAQ